MSVAAVARDIAGPPGLSQKPSDPVTLRNISGLSGPGLCRATGTFPTSQQSPKFDKTVDCCHPLGYLHRGLGQHWGNRIHCIYALKSEMFPGFKLMI